MRRALIVWLALLALPAAAGAETRTYVIAIGNDAPPARAVGGDSDLHALKYSDDDAAAMYSFFEPLSVHATLLTILDEESQHRFPALAPVARPPTLDELRRTIAWHKARFEADRHNGDDPVLVLFYSGHGNRAEGQSPALTMLDGPLTQEVLYDDILAQLPAAYVHVLVDACYAEAVVRPRDLQAPIVDLGAGDLRRYAAHETLARFPNVGAVVATSSTAQTHEWDLYREGVFTHEVLSGLRGAADVNHDNRIEYSELFAFLTAANREVTDARARLEVLAHPPMVNRRAPLVDLGLMRGGVGRLVGAGNALGWFIVEDGRGNRLADVRPERGYQVSLTLPSDQDLYVRSRNRELHVRLSPGEVVDVSRLTPEPIATYARGAVESALQRGLFAAAFGPEYYRGFVDGRSDFVPVSLPEETRPVPAEVTRPRPSHRAAWASFGIAGGLIAGAVVCAGLAGQALADFDQTSLQREATDARNRFNVYEPVAITGAVLGGVGAAVGAWLWVRAGRASVVTSSSAGGATGLAISF